MEKIIFNILIFGNKGVGKTTLIKSILKDQVRVKVIQDNILPLEFFQELIYPELMEKIKSNFPYQEIAINFKELHLDEINCYSYNLMDAGIFVFDTTNKKSIVTAPRWFEKIDERRSKIDLKIPIIIVGTKIDDYIREDHIKREVNYDEIDIIKINYNCYDSFDICALFDHDAERIFKILLNVLLKDKINVLIGNNNLIKDYYFTDEISGEKNLVSINKDDMKIINDLEKSLLTNINYTNHNLIGSNKFRVRDNRIVTLELSLRRSINISESIGDLEYLRQLEIIARFLEPSVKNSLIKIPNSITELEKLISFTIHYTNIAELPENIGNLSNLEELKSSYNNIKYLPKSLFDLKKLKTLEINYNPLYTIPDEIGNLTNLQELELNGTRIEFIPQSIVKLKKLEWLSLFDNSIDYFPEFLCTLNNLKHIDLSENNIPELPDEIGNLTNLRELSLRFNYLTTIPDSLNNLHKLKKLELGNVDLWGLLKKKNFNKKILDLEKNDLFIASINLHNRGVVMKNELKINDYITLKLKNNITNIYISGEIFIQCKYLLLKLPVSQLEDFADVNSIDDASERLSDRLHWYPAAFRGIKPETEFRGHCSNIQAWVENNYDTRLLHRNLAFPLLKKLAEAGDRTAKKVFKDEIVNRFLEGNRTVRLYLIVESYLSFFNKDEIKMIMDEIDKNDDIYQMLENIYHKKI